MGDFMSQVSPVLRKYTDGYGWWCPGCKNAHMVPVDAPTRPSWGFDGNLECPTFTPSYRQFIPAQPAEGGDPAEPERTLCHCFVKGGMIQFLGDCEHELANQTVPMTDMSTITGYGWGDGDD